MKKGLSLFVSLICLNSAFGQSSFYDPDVIQEIRIYFYQPNWDQLLDDFYVAGNGDRLTCDIVVNGTELDSVGLRYKGFSSVSVDYDKNPFNIKLNSFFPNQHYQGITKIKLSNVIQDPSFIREVMSYEVARKYMPASGANFAEVYINDVYWGLYTNVESVDEIFLNDRFGENHGPFFKCNPDVLDFDGENANLGNSPGTDTAAYTPFYDKRSDYGWTEFYHLIDTLHDHTASVEELLNVDRTLWMHAFNYGLMNFDSYVGYAQNYYMYQDDAKQFNPILWDLNMSFGSFRLADASDHWDGFTIAQAKVKDPLQHLNSVSVYARPLMRKLFENDTYKRMYLAHMRTIMDENIANNWHATRGAEFQSLIDQSVLNDVNKFYGYDDFQDNLNTTVTDLIDYPGITDLMDDRNTYLQSYPGFPGAPEYFGTSSEPGAIALGGSVTIKSTVLFADEVYLAYRFGNTGRFTTVTMLDDGTQNDGGAGDGEYGRILNDIGNTLQYYVYAQNASAGRFDPERAAYEFYEIQSQISAGDLVLNEIGALNENTATDQFGQSNDWIELYNPTNYAVSTAGLFLTDTAGNWDKWEMPDAIVEPDGYLIIWADEDGEQGDDHANFQLSSLGEFVGLSYGDSASVLDSVSFGLQTVDISYGRLPNGTGPWQTMEPTFGINNNQTGVEELRHQDVKVYPNPTTGLVQLRGDLIKDAQISLFSISGAEVHSVSNNSNSSLNLDLSKLDAGLYLMLINTEDQQLQKRIIVSQ